MRTGNTAGQKGDNDSESKDSESRKKWRGVLGVPSAFQQTCARHLLPARAPGGAEEEAEEDGCGLVGEGS